ncbi:hypothetical protein GCM10023108_00010 [Saccharopolyspora hordei]
MLNTYEIVCSKGYDPETAKSVKAFLTVAAHADPEQLQRPATCRCRTASSPRSEAVNAIS